MGCSRDARRDVGGFAALAQNVADLRSAFLVAAPKAVALPACRQRKWTLVASGKRPLEFSRFYKEARSRRNAKPLSAVGVRFSKRRALALRCGLARDV